MSTTRGYTIIDHVSIETLQLLLLQMIMSSYHCRNVLFCIVVILGRIPYITTVIATRDHSIFQ